MNKKQMDSKKVNKNLSKKVAPLVMSTSMMAATFLAAGAPISAAELDTKGVNPEVIEHVKNHGQEVSSLAKSLLGTPEKGKLVSKLAQANSSKTNDDPDNNDNIDETNNDVPQEGEISDGTATEEGTAEEQEVPTVKNGQVADDTIATEEEGTKEEQEAPTAEYDQVADDAIATEEEGTAEEQEAPTTEDGQVEEGTEAVEEDVAAEEPEAPTIQDGQVEDDAIATEEEGVAEEPEEPTAEEGQEAVEEDLAAEDGQVDGSQNQEDDSSTWVEETYQFIGAGYQSVIGYYQYLIEQNLAQSSEESDNVEEIDVVSDVSTDVGETDTTTLEADTSQDSSVDIADTGLINDTDVNLESPVVAENKDQSSDIETPEQETVESVENTVSDLEEPIQTVNEEVSSATETEQLSQNEEEKESNQISLKDKMIGYYQDLVASFANFMSFLK
ncbi:hypothetical protein ACIQYS_10675 [Psychrobacillus sp. NPDC096426]|uniref:hypothetical protein n=1 Tax=Psychrobacillus sp. NPDC096426 TaxID=3364491 RepID=UPI00380F10D1